MSGPVVVFEPSWHGDGVSVEAGGGRLVASWDPAWTAEADAREAVAELLGEVFETPERGAA